MCILFKLNINFLALKYKSRTITWTYFQLYVCACVFCMPRAHTYFAICTLVVINVRAWNPVSLRSSLFFCIYFIGSKMAGMFFSVQKAILCVMFAFFYANRIDFLFLFLFLDSWNGWSVVFFWCYSTVLLYSIFFYLHKWKLRTTHNLPLLDWYCR